MDINFALELFGLNSAEIKVYLALIELGQATAQAIAKKTGIIRQTVYNTLDLLKEKGLVSEIVISKVKHYSPSSPDVLAKIEAERKSAVDEIVPALKKKFSVSKEIPKVQAFFGAKSIDTIYKDTLSSKTPLYWVEPYIVTAGVMEEYKLENYIRKRVQSKVQLRMIVDMHSKEQMALYKSNKKELRETRFNNSIKNLDSSFVIYNNKVAIYSVKGNIIGVIIESEQIKNMFLEMFNIFWNSGKKA